MDDRGFGLFSVFYQIPVKASLANCSDKLTARVYLGTSKSTNSNLHRWMKGNMQSADTVMATNGRSKKQLRKSEFAMGGHLGRLTQITVSRYLKWDAAFRALDVRGTDYPGLHSRCSLQPGLSHGGPSARKPAD